jgi:hypothetical protein
MADINDDLVIMVGNSGIYWPGYQVNTLGDYNTYEGYKMKMSDVNSLAFLGEMVEDQTVTFPAGYHMLPVLTNEPVNAIEFFDGLPIDFVFGMDGTVYWPEGPIYTLETLIPGYGYLVKLNAEATFDFGFNLPKTANQNKPVQFENTTTWNDVDKTGDIHMIAVSSNASEELESGDIIGVFNIDDVCTGMAKYSGNGEAIAIPVFADDITTEVVDGMIEYEPLRFKVFRSGVEIELNNPVYSTEMPNYDGVFAVNGWSMITSFKEGATAIEGITEEQIVVYPNPSEGIFNIGGVGSTYELQVTNSHGQMIAIQKIHDDFTLDISDHPTGIYFIKLISNEGTKLIKVIKQ